MALFWGGCGTLGGRALREEVRHWGQTSSADSLTLLPVCPHCFLLVVEDVDYHAFLLPCLPTMMDSESSETASLNKRFLL